MPSSASAPASALLAFLSPLLVHEDSLVALSRAFADAFTHLAAESANQFLPTPIAESVLLPINRKNKNQGRYLAIDIGGTNLRVGFIELLGDGSPAPRPETTDTASETNGHANDHSDRPCLRHLHERSWPIQEHLKSENADSLFAWIGSCIAAVVRDGCVSLGLDRDATLPMGVTFSFPMEQASLSEAKLMSMGKGFAITGTLDLGSYLIKGYEEARSADPSNSALPPIAIAAITNDAVATLVSFTYEHSSQPNQKPAMGVICGTGCNATLLLSRAKLHPSKQGAGKDTTETAGETEKIVVNTEWSINGTAAALRSAGFISRWDDQLSQAVESPGFQPLEYMTAGRYLGELGRILLVDYLRSVLSVDETTLPAKFLRRFEPRNTQFLGQYRTGQPQPFRAMLAAEFPEDAAGAFRWTDDMAEALYHIAKAIEVRAAAIVAAAIVGLLDCAGDLPGAETPADETPAETETPLLELVVGYTGGCIVNFQDYLADCQRFLDALVTQRYGAGSRAPVRIVLRPCHDGGIKGAGILVPVALASQAGMCH